MEHIHGHQLCVLLADDDEDDRTFFREALDELGIQTLLHTVTDGVQLLELVLRKESLLPDLIFLDLNMPGKNGKECLREIRAIPHLRDTPVIIFSTSANLRDIDETFHNGASLYVQKPSGFTLMVELLDKVFRINWGDHISKADRSKFYFS